MIGLVLQLLLSVVATLLLFCVPGWAISRMLELHLRVPAVAIPAVAFAFGLGVWTLVLAVGLAFGWPILTTLAVYGAVAVVLLGAMRRRERRHPRAQLGTANAAAGWTIVVIALAGCAAAVLRTRIAFDTLFHLGMVRRLAELPSPTFENLDRVVGAGINPAYALPSWQGAMAAISALTRLDPATVVEASAIVGVLLAACCAAALGRAVTDTRAGELAGVSAYAFLRVTFPRRELEGDGVAYAALPGNIALDVLLPLLLVATVLLLRARPGARRDGSLVTLAAVATVLLLVLHANYIVYVAIIGLGVALWLLAAGPWGRRVARRITLVASSIALPGLVVLAALLPLLMLLDHFGTTVETRIDYHLASIAGHQLVRPGHLYDWFAAPGLFGMFLLPWAAWISRGASRALVAGGSLALFAFALAPPLLELLGESGSLTIGLRLPRPLGVLLIAAAAIALPDLVARTVRLAARITEHRGRVAGWIARLGPLLLVFVASAAYGYPLVRREPAQYGWNWPTLVAAAALLVVLVLAIRARRTTESLDVSVRDDTARSLPIRSMALALVALSIAMLPSGFTSMRRAAWQSRELVAAYRADDLRCLDGVQAKLRELPPGDVLLADPVTAYAAQALAPEYVVGDFKTWNGSTDPERVKERIDLIGLTFQAQDREIAQRGLEGLMRDYDASWLLVAGGEVVPPIGSELDPYDARGVRELLASGDIDAALVASGPGRLPSNVEDEERAACDLQLWRLGEDRGGTGS
jgi:hypothetical protein